MSSTCACCGRSASAYRWWVYRRGYGPAVFRGDLRILCQLPTRREGRAGHTRNPEIRTGVVGKDAHASIVSRASRRLESEVWDCVRCDSGCARLERLAFNYRSADNPFLLRGNRSYPRRRVRRRERHRRHTAATMLLISLTPFLSASWQATGPSGAGFAEARFATGPEAGLWLLLVAAGVAILAAGFSMAAAPSRIHPERSAPARASDDEAVITWLPSPPPADGRA